ncbi:MAG: very short patch repair endonuclease [Gemmatimonadaceae bacterium]
MTSPERSRLMGRVRQRGTAPELAVRAALRDLGVHYRVNARDLPGSPDVVNRSKRFAIFVHGCYWHRHPSCRLTTTPATNVAFWTQKFAQNEARDHRNIERLRLASFQVHVVWECETRDGVTLRANLQRFLSRSSHKTEPERR